MKKFTIVFIIAVCFFAINTNIFGASKIWNASLNNNWNTADNWTPSGVPGASDDVTININTAIQVDVSTTINSLTISGSVSVTFISSGGGRIITIANTGSSIGSGSTLTIQGSTGTGTRSMTLAFSGTNQTMSIAGTLLLTAVGEGTIYDATNSISTVTGTIKNDGTGTGTVGVITSTSSNLIFSSGGIYEHALKSGTIPTATWDANSNCIITGVTTAIPAGLNQAFGNLTYNCPLQTTAENFAPTSISGNLQIISTGTSDLLNLNVTSLTIAGSFIQTGGKFYVVSSTGARTLDVNGNFNISGGTFIVVSGTGTGALNINGDFNISGGTFIFKETAGAATLNVDGNFNQSAGTFTFRNNETGTATMTVLNNFSLSGTAAFNLTTKGIATLNVGGNYSLTSGTHNLSDGTSGNTAFGTINITGNFSHTGGTITETSTGNGTVNFNGTTMQTYTSGGTVSNIINFTVNSGAYLQMADASTVVNGGGTFILSSGATLGIKSSDGITSGGATGNIQVTGARNFNTGANYTFNGTTSQITGNGLPATLNNLTIDNSAGISLSSGTTVSGILSLTNGLLTLGANNLTIDPAGSITGGSANSYVITDGAGQLKRTVSNNDTYILFPVGLSAYNPMNFKLDVASVTDIFGVKVSDVIANPGYQTGKTISRQWDITKATGNASNATIQFQFNAGEGLTDYGTGQIGHWNGSSYDEILASISGTGPYIIENSSLSLITSFSPFIVGNAYPMPVELSSFTANVISRDVKLDWTTATEINNAGFEILRSAQNDNVSWTKVGYITGNGTKTTPTNFTFEDKKLNTGKYNYRLKQIDYNGNFEYFNLTGEIEIGVPNKFNISQNYPNPFNPTTKIDFELPYDSKVSLKLYDISGREVITLVNEQRTAGYYTVQMNGNNLSSGMYFYRIIAEGNGQSFVSVKKLVLIK